MKARALLSVVVCNVASVLLATAAAFGAVHFTKWGRFTAEVMTKPAKQLARSYGDPTKFIQNAAIVPQWIFGPTIALLVGCIAGLLYRRTDWRISTLGLVSLVLFLSMPTTITNTASALLYILIGWVGMKLVVFARRLPDHHSNHGS
jgi:hypothetical protein